MSKSLKRVKAALKDAGLSIEPLEMDVDTRTAQQAADVAGCHVDQIGKSVIFAGVESGKAILFVTAGGNTVDTAKATALAGEPLCKADAALIRHQTGFAIGGVSPVGHLNPICAFMDLRLLEFDSVWVAAGTPRHIFEIAPDVLANISNATLAAFTSK